MEKLWRYTPQSGFTNKNAGFSMWCFGTYRGKEYFIKQFLSPKFPADDKVASPEKIAKRIKDCKEFEQRRKKLYTTLTDYSDGNDVRILEFFRVASRYYIVTEKVEALPWTVETVAALEEKEKRRICAIIAHAIAALHKGGMVHSDIKHDNILYTYTEAGQVTAKIIDFDGGFLECDPPSMEDGVTGDMNYFSPEVCARAYENERPLTCKLDIFAMGVLFHQYFSGELPEYDHEAASCPGEAVLQGHKMQLNEKLPKDVSALIEKMLLEDPQKRPTAQEVFESLRPFHPKEEFSIFEDYEETMQLLCSHAASESPAETAGEDHTHFCSMCGRAISGTSDICDSCEEKRLRNNSLSDDASPFFRPGDL